MLDRSHRRLEERLGELQRAAAAIVRERAGAADLEAVDVVLGYLERSAARHETDEEESLFPRLRGHRELLTLLNDLGIEHELHRNLVSQLRTLRNGWPAAGPDAGHGAALAIAVSDLARAYRSHIEREERELLPAAREKLRADEIDAITSEMDRRRNGDDGDRGGGQRGPRRLPAGATGPRVREL